MSSREREIMGIQTRRNGWNTFGIRAGASRRKGSRSHANSRPASHLRLGYDGTRNAMTDRTLTTPAARSAPRGPADLLVPLALVAAVGSLAAGLILPIMHVRSL